MPELFMTNKQILITSDEAAKFVTNIEGWVDRHGRFWGKDKQAAQWSGCTHIICPECGKPTKKIYTICEDCRKKKAIEQYNAKECKRWNGNIPLYSEMADEYFLNQDELDYFLDGEERKCIIESLRLIICEPIYLRQIDEDYFYDDLLEDTDISSDVANALKNLNRIISEQKPIGWEPGKYRI